MGDLEIREIKKEDASLVALLHTTMFKNFFLTSLGTNFLSFFYGTLIESKNSIGIVIISDRKLIGFAIGNTRNSDFYKKIILDNLVGYALQILGLIFTKPLSIFRILRNLFFSSPHNMNNLPCLLSICADSKSKVSGVGRKLIHEYEKKLQSVYCTEYFLTTDANNNDRVNEFYKNNGFIKIRLIKQSNKRQLNIYHKTLI
jgi:ribosomal protein S18 acetylase RimI-like enzyme